MKSYGVQLIQWLKAYGEPILCFMPPELIDMSLNVLESNSGGLSL